MPRIKTQTALVEYILRQLGAPSISVDLTPEQIGDIIDDTIQEFSEYAMSGTEDKILIVELVDGQMDYVLDDRVQAITEIRATNNFNNMYRLPGGYVLAESPLSLTLLSNLDSIDLQSITANLSKLSMLESLFDLPIHYEYNYNSKVLRLFENTKTSKLMLKVALEYIPQAEDNIYNHPWIKAYAIAKSKIVWGNVLGKFSSALVGGSTINYDRLISEGQTDVERLNLELLENWSEPLGIDIS